MRATEIDHDIRRAAGCLIYAKDSANWLFTQRSSYVNEPLAWAIPGGGVEPGEDYLEAAIREAREEIGFDLSSAPNKLIYAIEEDWPGLIYKTFAFVVDKQFKPVLNWEVADYKWCKMDEIPMPLHPGMDAMLGHDRSAEILHDWLTNLTNS